jgi:hypothetical protein
MTVAPGRRAGRASLWGGLRTGLRAGRSSYVLVDPDAGEIAVAFALCGMHHPMCSVIPSVHPQAARSFFYWRLRRRLAEFHVRDLVSQHSRPVQF